jgi:hypothetical protein
MGRETIRSVATAAAQRIDGSLRSINQPDAPGGIAVARIGLASGNLCAQARISGKNSPET